MPTETTNYKLKKPLSSEKYDVEVFNENADKIEAGMLANYQAIQTKQNTITGSATTITSATLTKDRVVITNSSGKIAVSDITSTELGYLDGVTSNVQTQINSVASSVTSEANTRASADATLQGKIDAEASARSSADTTLQANIDKKVGKSGNETIEGTKTFTTIPVVTKSTSSTATGMQLTTADWVIGKVNASATTLEGKITAEATARASGDSALQGKIDAETTARGTAITNLQTTLQTNIDGKVSKSGNETINGDKTFNNALSTGNFIIYGNDSTGRKSIVWRPYGSNDQHQVGWLINNDFSYCAINVVANLTSPFIKIGNQNIPAQAPTPSSTTDDSDKIATTHWVANAGCVVHTTGAETIDGIKTFTSIPVVAKTGTTGISFKSTNFDITENPQTYGLNFDMGAYDKNAKVYFKIKAERGSANNRNATMTISNGSINAELGVKIYGDGTTTSGFAPTTPSNATSNEIATANWCLGKFQSKVTISTSAPSGGNNGDLWAVYE